MLSTDKALELHALLKPHLPESEGLEFLPFVREITNSMKGNDWLEYVGCVQLMYGLELDEVVELDSFDVFTMFLEGLIENNVFGLVRFCESLGL